MQELQKEIDSLRTPKSFELNGSAIEFTTDMIYVHANTANIIGVLESNDPQLKNLNPEVDGNKVVFK